MENRESNMWYFGTLVKWPNTSVCLTDIREFESLRYRNVLVKIWFVKNVEKNMMEHLDLADFVVEHVQTVEYILQKQN